MFIRSQNGSVVNTKYVQSFRIRQYNAPPQIINGVPVFLPSCQFAVEAMLTDKRSVTMQEFCTNDAEANRQAAEAYTAELFAKLNGGKK